MAIQEINEPTKFQTSDGRTYEDSEQAKRHEEFIEAKNEFEMARNRFHRKLAKEFVTADGYPITTDIWAKFYRIRDWDRPEIETIEPWWGKVEVDDHNYFDTEKPEVRFYIKLDNHRGNDVHLALRKYSPSELYYRRENAEKAMVAALREYADTIIAEANKLEGTTE